MTDKTLKLIFKCPKCGEKITINVNPSQLDYKGGIAAVTILHGSPPHAAIVYVDKNGNVRSVEVPEMALVVGDTGAPKPPRREPVAEETLLIDPNEFVKKFGNEVLAQFLFYITANTPIYVVTTDSTEEVTKLFDALVKYLDFNTVLEFNKIINRRGFSLLDSKFYLVNEPKLKNSLVYYVATGKLKGYVTKNTFFSKLIKKYFLKGKEGINQIIKEIEPISKFVEISFARLKEAKLLDMKKVLKEIGASGKEYDIIIECLKTKGVRFEKSIAALI